MTQFNRNEIRLTDEIERRMVRDSIRSKAYRAPLSGDTGGFNEAVGALRGMFREISFNMNKIGEARYS